MAYKLLPLTVNVESITYATAAKILNFERQEMLYVEFVR